MAFDMNKYVFPLALGRAGTSKVTAFLGTGFFVKMNGVFLTAKHIFDFSPKADLEFVASLKVGDGRMNFHHHKVSKIINHPSLDISICQIEGMTNNEYVRISEDEPCMGTIVSSFGYGDTQKENDFIQLHGRLFQGVVAAVRDNYEWRGITTPSYELPFPILNGASGSPIFGEGDPLTVIGLAYGNHKSKVYSEEEEEITEVIASGTKTITKNIFNEFKTFGLAHKVQTIRETIELFKE